MCESLANSLIVYFCNYKIIHFITIMNIYACALLLEDHIIQLKHLVHMD